MFIYQKNKVLSNTAISSKALILNKLIRCITIVLTSACISTSISVIYESYRFYQQKSFYESYSDYVVLQNLKVETGGETFEYEGEFYKKYVKELEIFFLCERMALSSGKIAVIANYNTMDYIKSAIPELENVVFDKDVYIIHKDSELINSMDMEFLKPTIDCEIAEVTYHENAKLVSIELNYDNQFTRWCENPIIVYYNTDVAILYDESMISMTVPIVLCLIKNDVVIDEFMRSNHISYSCTNMMDIFEQQWIKLKRTSYLSCILLVLLFVLQILVILNIVNLEYKVNAIELSIKKIIGYSMVERFRRQYVVSLLLYVFSLAVSLIVAGTLKFGSLPFITYGIMLSYLIETVIFTLFAARYDRKNVQKILKGGAA